MQGRYKARLFLRQDIIAEELGVSKIPLREVLMQLRAEGLVTFMLNRGAVVSELSAPEVEEIFAVRIAKETVAIQKAIPLSAQSLKPAHLVANLLLTHSMFFSIFEIIFIPYHLDPMEQSTLSPMPGFP